MKFKFIFTFLAVRISSSRKPSDSLFSYKELLLLLLLLAFILFKEMENKNPPVDMYTPPNDIQITQCPVATGSGMLNFDEYVTATKGIGREKLHIVQWHRVWSWSWGEVHQTHTHHSPHISHLAHFNKSQSMSLFGNCCAPHSGCWGDSWMCWLGGNLD